MAQTRSSPPGLTTVSRPSLKVLRSLDERSLAPDVIARAIDAASSSCSERENARLTADKALVEHELRETPQQLSKLRAATSTDARAARLSATSGCSTRPKPDERRELMRLVIKRIEYRGPGSHWASSSSTAVRLTYRGRFETSNEWLPNSSSSNKFASCVVVDCAAARKRLVQRDPPERANSLVHAIEWQRQLAAGEVSSRAEIACSTGLSRARVTLILAALPVRGPHRTGRL